MDEPADALTVLLQQRLEDYLDCFRRFDIDGLSTYWDLEEARPLYIAEEVERRMLDHAAIRAYWTGTSKALARLWVRSAGHRAALRAPDLAALDFDMDWACRTRAPPDDPPIGGSLQVSAHLRRRGGRWLFVSWVEAPLAPLPWLRRAYRGAGRAIAGEEG